MMCASRCALEPRLRERSARLRATAAVSALGAVHRPAQIPDADVVLVGLLALPLQEEADHEDDGHDNGRDLRRAPTVVGQLRQGLRWLRGPPQEEPRKTCAPWRVADDPPPGQGKRTI